MIRVQAPSRLHFGLLALPDGQGDFWPDLDDGPTVRARHFGGVGLMLQEPGIDLTITPATAWSATGPNGPRALSFARHFCASLSLAQSFRLHVERCPPEHVGLGTGTQLGMAVARALALAIGQADMDTAQLAAHVGRGLRSALGIHGFAQGGFLVEGGKAPHTLIAPLVCRQPFPADWHIVLIVPRGVQGAHGSDEKQAFAQLATALPRTEALCRLVLLGMIPALVERDLDAFGEALYDFNARAGEMFAPWQGGRYAHPHTASLIQSLRARGLRAVGQSSWGPTVFAIAGAAEAREVRAALLRDVYSPDEVIVTQAANTGAT
jgi:beta-ribofuranosylaminobenzene 5'-phosphate synthase